MRDHVSKGGCTLAVATTIHLVSEKKRSEDDIKAQDEKNQIKEDLMKPSSPTRDLSQEIDDHEDYDGYSSPEEELGDADDDPENPREEEEEEEGYSDSDEEDGGV